MACRLKCIASFCLECCVPCRQTCLKGGLLCHQIPNLNVVFFSAAFATAKSQLGGIDIVVNNAGIGDEGDRWENTVDVNLVSIE